jgi:hypothetical protein
MFRDVEILPKTCMKCPKGYFSTGNRALLSREWNEWPLRCTPCSHFVANDMFNAPVVHDRTGQQTCKYCPANTEVLRWPASDQRHCVCIPGHFSPFALQPLVGDDPIENPASTVTLAGMPCSACHEDELLMPPDLEMPKCGTDYLEMVVDYEEGAPKTEMDLWGCVDVTNGVCFGYDRVCMVGCPGGVVLPISKKWFWVEEWAYTKSFKGIYQEGPLIGMPGDLLELMLGVCTPMEACLGYNTCSRPYLSAYCATCRFKYYKPNGK